MRASALSTVLVGFCALGRFPAQPLIRSRNTWNRATPTAATVPTEATHVAMSPHWISPVQGTGHDPRAAENGGDSPLP
jgi:hypothetical protein